MKKTSFLIVGKHAVTEALKNSNRKVSKVFLTENSKKKLNKENQNLDLLKNITLFYKTKKELDRLCSKDEISHQELIAEIEHSEEKDLKDYINEYFPNRKLFICEFGCGSGNIAINLALDGHAVCATDLSKDVIDKVQKSIKNL